MFYTQDFPRETGPAPKSIPVKSDALRNYVKKRKNRIESEEEDEDEEDEEEGPARPPAPPNEESRPVETHETDRVLGGPEIAAAAAREAERMSLPHRALNEKIKALQATQQKKEVSQRSTGAPPLAVKPAQLVDYADDDEDLGEPVAAISEAKSEAKAGLNFIGPVLPAGRTPLRDVNPKPTEGQQSEPSSAVPPTVSTTSFYGASTGISQGEKKKRWSDSASETSNKKPKHDRGDYYTHHKTPQGLWKDTLHDTVRPASGNENIPKYAMIGGVKKNMKPKPKKRSIM